MPRRAPAARRRPAAREVPAAAPPAQALARAQPAGARGPAAPVVAAREAVHAARPAVAAEDPAAAVRGARATPAALRAGPTLATSRPSFASSPEAAPPYPIRKAISPMRATRSRRSASPIPPAPASSRPTQARTAVRAPSRRGGHSLLHASTRSCRRTREGLQSPVNGDRVGVGRRGCCLRRPTRRPRRRRSHVMKLYGFPPVRSALLDAGKPGTPTYLSWWVRRPSLFFGQTSAPAHGTSRCRHPDLGRGRPRLAGRALAP